MNRADILNILVRRRKYVSYLEIGVRNPRHNFALVQAARKHGVDPAGRCSHVMTSDEFFSRCETRYDLIFIDGLHTEEQVARDIAGGLRCLAPYGTVAVHDCNPPTAWHQSEINNGGAWNGTVWKAFARFRYERPDYQAFVVDCDWGVGVIHRRGAGVVRLASERPRHQHSLPAVLNFEYLVQHRESLLGLVTPAEFVRSVVAIA